MDLNISTVRKNLAANFIGNGWIGLLGIVLIPFYIKLLGIEAWGVVGLYASLQSICLLLDMGLSATLGREMARLSAQKDKEQEMRNLVRTLELIYWAVAAAIGVSIFALAPFIANRWLRAGNLSPETINQAVRVMALAIALQWPFGLYSGGVSGLQRQVLLNGINISIATLRGAGAVLILWKISPTLQAFFCWQVGISALQTCLVGAYLWRSLPRTPFAAGFRGSLLRDTWRFAAGISGVTVMSLILIQMDKVVLSGLLRLELFGYYVLAGTVASSIYLLINPVFSAFAPRFTQLVSLDDEVGLKRLYHRSCQLMSVVILPVSCVMAFHSKEILFLWTGDATTVEYTHLVLSILVAGTALNGLMHLPYCVQLAYGWTRLAFCINAVAVVILAPSMVCVAALYGAVGAAIIWVFLNLGFVLVGIPLMHRRLLKGEQRKWYLEDVGLPLMVAVCTGFFSSLLIPGTGSRLGLAANLACGLLFVAGSTLLATPVTRASFFGFCRSRKRMFSGIA